MVFALTGFLSRSFRQEEPAVASLGDLLAPPLKRLGREVRRYLVLLRALLRVVFVAVRTLMLIPEQAAPLFRNDGAPLFRSIAAQRSDQSSPTIPG